MAGSGRTRENPLSRRENMQTPRRNIPGPESNLLSCGVTALTTAPVCCFGDSHTQFERWNQIYPPNHSHNNATKCVKKTVCMLCLSRLVEEKVKEECPNAPFHQVPSLEERRRGLWHRVPDLLGHSCSCKCAAWWDLPSFGWLLRENESGMQHLN